MKTKKLPGPDGCWIALGTTVNGYALVTSGGKARLYHRVMWERRYGPIPEGFILHHECREKRCWNYRHLILVRNQDHTMVHHPENPTTILANKSHCVRGHLFDAGNTYVTAKGHRTCRACRAISQRKWRRKSTLTHVAATSPDAATAEVPGAAISPGSRA